LLISGSIFAYNQYGYQPDSSNYYDNLGRQQGSSRINQWTGETEYRNNFGQLESTSKKNQWTGEIEFKNNMGMRQGYIKKNNFGY
jgi:hypothetical protein